MLGAAHALAIDSKNLLDVVDATRLKYPHLNQQTYSYHDVQNDENLSTSRSSSMERTNLPVNATYAPTPVSCTIVSYPSIETYSQSAQQVHATNNSSITNSSQQVVDS